MASDRTLKRFLLETVLPLILPNRNVWAFWVVILNAFCRPHWENIKFVMNYVRNIHEFYIKML